MKLKKESKQERYTHKKPCSSCLDYSSQVYHIVENEVFFVSCLRSVFLSFLLSFVLYFLSYVKEREGSKDEI